MGLIEFVAEKFSKDLAVTLANIHRGGTNNAKGSAYEHNFAIVKLCEAVVGANEIATLQNTYVSTQELGFVDDICIRKTPTSEKTNFQAKNSDGAAADWDEDMSVRFNYQQQIDTEYHGFTAAKQVLVVSCPKKEKANKAKIKSEMRGYSDCFYFPNHQNAFELLTDDRISIRRNIETMIGSTELEKVDYAFKLLLGNWHHSTSERSVYNMLRDAHCDGYPRTFQKYMLQQDLGDQEPVTKTPEWLATLVQERASLQGMSISVESSRIKLGWNGLDVSIDAVRIAEKPSVNIVTTLIDPKSLITFIVSKAKDGLIVGS